MEESILNSIKKLLGIPVNDSAFDIDVIIGINSVFSILNQMGVGPSEPFIINSDEETWNDFLENKSYLEMVKSYTYMKVQMMFDTPTSGAVSEARKSMISEFESRMFIAEENKREANNE